MATGSTQPAPECGDKIACPAVSHCAVHVLRAGIGAAIQTWCQHDSSVGPGRESNQRHLQSAHGFFKDRSVNQDLMLADFAVLSADDHCRTAHARQYARHAAAATAAALYARNDPCSPEFDAELSAACALDYMGAAAWNGLHTRDGWYSFARTCPNTALSHRVCPEAALTHTDPFVVGGAKRATGKEIRSGINATALVRRGLRQPAHGLHGWPRETAQHRRPRWVADLRNPTARDHIWYPAARSVYTNAPSAVVHLIMS